MQDYAVYRDGFENWSDVQSNFAMQEPEPDAVYFAEYDLSQAYEGSAEVVYRRGDKFYVVEGGHCSCYGLQGQWEPTEYASRDEILACIRKRDGEPWPVVAARIEAGA